MIFYQTEVSERIRFTIYYGFYGVRLSCFFPRSPARAALIDPLPPPVPLDFRKPFDYDDARARN